MNTDLARPTGPVGLGGRRVGWVKRNAAFAWTPPFDPLSVDAPSLMFPLRVAFRKSMAATTAAVRRRLEALRDGDVVAAAVRRSAKREADTRGKLSAIAEARRRAMGGLDFQGDGPAPAPAASNAAAESRLGPD